MANMKKIFIGVIVIGLTFTSIAAFAQTAQEAVLALKKLQARCQVGISYNDYSNAVADAKFPVNLFMESEDAKKSPELVESINKVMGHYEYAGSLWRHKMSDRFAALIRCGSELAKEINKLYPQAEYSTQSKEFCYYVDSLLPVIWAEASNELINTTNLSKITKGNTSKDCDKLKEENANLKKQLELLKSKKKK